MHLLIVITIIIILMTSDWRSLALETKPPRTGQTGRMGTVRVSLSLPSRFFVFAARFAFSCWRIFDTLIVVEQNQLCLVINDQTKQQRTHIKSKRTSCALRRLSRRNGRKHVVFLVFRRNIITSARYAALFCFILNSTSILHGTVHQCTASLVSNGKAFI